MNITLSSGVATIIFTKNSNNNSNKFQYNTSSPRFTNYKTGTQKNCTLYKKDSGGYTVLAPSIACADNVVTITNNEEGATVYYTTDGTTPDATSTLYTAPFAITETCTVKAVAIKDGESSIPTTYTATFVAPAEVEPFTSSIAAVDDVITAARGTEITFTSLHAAKIEAVIAIEGQDDATESVESDKFVYTVSEAASIMLTSYNVDGTQAHEALYEIALEAAPLCGEVVFNPASGSAVIAGSEVTITCENAAVITYFIEINGELGDAIEVEGSEAKVVVNEACTIHADAKNIDGVPSEAAEASYTIAEAPATGSAMFDFTDLEKTCDLHSGINVSDLPTATGSGINFGDYKGNFTNGVVTVSFAKGTNTSNGPRWWYSKNGYHVRMYANNTVTVTVNPGCEITSIEFTQGDDNDWAMGAGAPAGTWSGKTWTPTPAASAMMREAAKGVESVTFTPTGKTFFATMNVNYEQPTTGVGSVVVDDANAPVEYYNLQGVRVENPANGLYIRRQGNNVSKVFVR
ncbi:MAG: chitobiase/beta-hexosaminidase C-terminal domain-containing protein [Muribaculaceae bacterium]|nr:chitobiase/beta-hexosaminidase C-terminal domain-containing protein [Muribaculaceae bacterium]